MTYLSRATTLTLALVFFGFYGVFNELGKIKVLLEALQ